MAAKAVAAAAYWRRHRCAWHTGKTALSVEATRRSDGAAVDDICRDEVGAGFVDPVSESCTTKPLIPRIPRPLFARRQVQDDELQQRSGETQ